MFGFKKRRRARLRAQSFPEHWREILLGNVPYYRQLPPEDRSELHGHVHVLLAEKHFEGCGGLSLTDDIRVTIAGWGAVLLLHRETDYYPRLKSILVYPDAFVVPGDEPLDEMEFIDEEDVRLGESWGLGAVVLAWKPIRALGTDTVFCSEISPEGTDTVFCSAEPPQKTASVPGSQKTASVPGSRKTVSVPGSRKTVSVPSSGNVALHEFAHQIDEEDGITDGVPELDDDAAYAQWQTVMSGAYEALWRDIENNRQSFLDEYGATHPAEFFAVLTETFFMRPHPLKRKHPDLYEVLQQYFRQDPASVMPKT